MNILAEMRQSLVFFLFMLLLTFPVFLTESVQAKAVPTPEMLKKSIRTVSIENDAYSSLIVDASYFGGPDAVLTFTVLFERPGKAALYIRDNFDGTPLLMIAQGNALLYSPLEDRVTLFHNTGTLFKVGLKNKEFVLKAGFISKETPSGPELKNTVVLDLPSLIKRVTVGLESQKAKEGYLLSGYTPKGSYCQVLVDPFSSPSVKKMDIYPEGGSLPVFSFRRIEAGLYISQKNFKFPLKAIRDSGLMIQEKKVCSEIVSNLLKQIYGALFVRSALRYPALRPGLARMGLRNLDWDKIVETDKRTAPILRELSRGAGL